MSTIILAAHRGIDPLLTVRQTVVLPLHQWAILERVEGNDPSSTDWQPVVIPLYDTRVIFGGATRNRTE